jgi:hypothetical protein
MINNEEIIGNYGGKDGILNLDYDRVKRIETEIAKPGGDKQLYDFDELKRYL